MAQTTSIIKVLKRTLKAHEKRYSDVAEALNLSEASVKRLFSEEVFMFRRAPYSKPPVAQRAGGI